MRSLRRPASPYETFVDGVRPFLGKRLTELGGLVLFTAAVAMTVALATWSIEDPSLNHATEHAAHNVLGQPGAVISDLAMQLLGLGSLAFVLPPALWGVRLMRERDLPGGGARIALWIIGFCAASAVASALPPTARWPLPTGLGGVTGDGLLHIVRRILGSMFSGLAPLSGFGFAAIAIVCLTGACRFIPAEEESPEDFYPARRAADRHRDVREGDRDEPGLGLVGIGAVAQGLMRARASVAERVEGWRSGKGEDLMAPLRRSPPSAPSPIPICPGRPSPRGRSRSDEAPGAGLRRGPPRRAGPPGADPPRRGRYGRARARRGHACRPCRSLAGGAAALGPGPPGAPSRPRASRTSMNCRLSISWPRPVALSGEPRLCRFPGAERHTLGSDAG